ncbi:hypothetical protein KAR91_63820 [Candidatus Pacearchaeota archaeon]|nr:hypothetical protein [Candidatus Pacearchaeota archaeon]
METFKIGDIIRNKNPYWGEPSKKIVDMDEKQIYVVLGYSKYGKADSPKYREIMFLHEISCYRKATIFERMYLFIIGLMAEYII